MIQKTPIIDSSVTSGDIAYAIKRSNDALVLPEFEAAMSGHANCRYIYPVNSGIAAFYIILKALSGDSHKTEVVLPAYTAGSLVVAVRKAGLTPVLCDISLNDFNSDPEAMIKTVSDKTLAVLCVHMYGITMSAIEGLKQRLPAGVTVIEDCAQAMGSAIGGKPVGSFGDVSFFSFNRGKNLSVFGGGCIATNDAGISEAIARTVKSSATGKGEPGVLTLLKAITVSLALNPYVYGACFGLISRFKSDSPPLDFSVGRIGACQAALALSILRRFDLIAAQRRENGMLLINGLKGLKEITVPEVSGRGSPVFNRFPIVLTNRGSRDIVARRLWRAGIESSRMYNRPLHHLFDLGYGAGEFPNACYAAERLLTLPVHPSICRDRLSKAVYVIRGVLQ